MSIKFKRKLIKLSNSLFANIPSEISEALDLQPGQHVEIMLDGKSIIIKRYDDEPVLH